ncbi:MAG: CAP domain-containing protein [Clostridiales bacterium]|nr:CAP domain-containing protein [Candidatus Scatonaster coprocaballi]
MKFQRFVKLITKNLSLISILLAFVLGVIGMTGLRSKILDTSNWFMSEEEVEEKFGSDGEDDPNLASNTSVAANESSSDTQHSETALSSEMSSSSETALSSQLSVSDPSDSQDTTLSDASLTTADSSQKEEEMTSSTKIPSETTKKPKETKTSSISRETETQQPADSTTATAPDATTTEATTAATEATTAAATEATTAATTEATTAETTTVATTEATTTKSNTSLGNLNGSYDYDMARQVLDLVNAERAANGRAPLKWNDTLASDAAIRATELPVNWSHTRPDGSDWSTAGSGRAWGENLAMGQTSPAQALSDWMQSPTHKSNILDSDYTKMGVACYYCEGTYYWVQEFGG